jgi:hypothetical protein
MKNLAGESENLASQEGRWEADGKQPFDAL